MVCDIFSVQTYQLGGVSEFCSWVVGLKAWATTTTMLTVALEFIKHLIYKDYLFLLGLKAWDTMALLKYFILAPNHSNS